jgi:hypothetical protein
MNDIPNRTSIAISGCPKAKMMGIIRGTIIRAKNTGNIPPAIELTTAALIALPASPFCVIGNPSKHVAALAVSPGMFSSIEVMPPEVNTTACIAINNSMAVSAGRVKRKGSKIATMVPPPRPGIMPTNKPIITDKNMINKFIG